MSLPLALSSLLLAAPAVLAQSTGTGSCTDVHIFLARGWDEDYDNQRQTTLADDICSDLPDLSCDYEDVVYDAFSDDYCTAVEGGDSAGLSQINAYYAKCPSTTLVLSGYSEGSNIIGDILAGGSCGVDFTPLSTSSGASCNIAAAMLWGDPHHAPNQAYNVLNGTAGTGEGGLRSDAQAETLDYYTPRLHSYCQYDDLVCATGLGADLVSAHTNYFDLYSEDAASWAAGLVSSFQTGQYCNATTSSSSSSASTMPATSSAAPSSAPATTTTTASALSSPAPTQNSTSAASATPTELVIITDATTIYTTICPLTTAITANGTTSTSTYTGLSTITSTYSTTITTTASAIISGSLVAPASSSTRATSTPPPAPPSTMTTINGSTALIAYGTTTSHTTYANYPPFTFTSVSPVTTSFFSSWTNGTAAPTGARPSAPRARAAAKQQAAGPRRP